MLSTSQIEFYRENGYVVVPDVIGPDVLAEARVKLAELIEKSREVSASDAVYDLEEAHSPRNPRVRRIKEPHINGEIYAEMLKSPDIMDLVSQLIGPDLRMDHTKLNIKPARGGEPVEWHQDWAFYPHTNDDVLAIGVLLDDTDLSNGPMLVTPGTHTGEVWSHHGEDGRFAGLIDPDLIQPEISRAVPCMGRAGSMSFHHVRALHGSALNTSNRPRNLLLYEVAASDAWPLLGVKDFAEYDSRLLTGGSVVVPRMTPVPVRIPLPPPLRQGSIYETQSAATKSYFNRAA
jgi:ectoine hydroxylase-related dioxygenase (phytanoyl-CoA dioxygenase family)